MAVEKSLLVKIGADDSQMRTALTKAGGALKSHSAQFRKVGMGMTAAGGAIVGAMGLMVKSYVTAGDEVHKMSLRTGMSTEALSELKYAAELSGTSLATVEKSVKKMASSIGEAKMGIKTYTDAFALIGLEVEELEGLNPEEQWMKMAEGIAAIKDPTDRAYAAQKLFGKAGTELLPLFAEGAEGMEKMRQKARDLGLSISELAAKDAAQLGDAMTTLKGSLKGVTMAIASKLAPIITSIADKVSGFVTKIKAWMEAHPGLTKTIVIVVAALGGLLAILGPLVMILPALAAGFALLMGPIGLVIVAVMAIAAGAFLVIKNWKKIKAFFIGLWTKVKELFFNLVTFIIEKIVWLMEKLAKIPLIKKFVKGIQEGLEAAKASIADAKEKMAADTAAAAEEIKESGEVIKTSFKEVETATETMKTVVSSLYNTLVDEIKKATLSEYEYSKWVQEKKYEERKALLEKEIEEGKVRKEELLLLEQAHQLSMAEIEDKAAEEKRLKQEEQFAAYLVAKEELLDSINQMTMSELEYSKWALNKDYEAKKAAIEKTIEETGKGHDLLTLLNEKHHLDTEKAEQEHADKLTAIQANTISALTSLYGNFLSDTLDAFSAWGEGSMGLLKGIGMAFKNLAKAAIQALKDIVVQEMVSAAKTFIAEKAKAISKVITSVMSLPFPLNILAVGGAIAAVTLLFKKIKLFGKGGIAGLHGPELIMAGERGPELITPLNKAGAGFGGGFTVNQKNYFYGNISNVGDLDEISKRLGQRVQRAFERGRK